MLDISGTGTRVQRTISTVKSALCVHSCLPFSPSCYKDKKMQLNPNPRSLELTKVQASDRFQACALPFSSAISRLRQLYIGSPIYEVFSYEYIGKAIEVV